MPANRQTLVNRKGEEEVPEVWQRFWTAVRMAARDLESQRSEQSFPKP
jgi:hypothetical protein